MDLVLVHILQGKGVRRAFLGVKADGDSLNRPDIIHRTDLVKICQCNMPVLLVDLHRSNGGGDLLDQCQVQFLVTFVCTVDQILQCGPSQPP